MDFFNQRRARRLDADTGQNAAGRVPHGSGDRLGAYSRRHQDRHGTHDCDLRERAHQPPSFTEPANLLQEQKSLQLVNEPLRRVKGSSRGRERLTRDLHEIGSAPSWTRRHDYLVVGLPNFVASIATFTSTLSSFAVYR